MILIMKTFWNYRVMRIQHHDKNDEYGVFEVYYNKDGSVDGWTEDAVRIYTDNIEEIEETLLKMQESLKKPILDYQTGKEVK